MPAPLISAVPHHFCVSVPDRDAAIAWWHKMFGFAHEFSFEIPHIKAKGAFIRNGSMRIEIFEIDGSNPVPEERLKPNTDLKTQGMKHFCFAVEDVQAVAETLHANGIDIVGIARGRGKPMMKEEDPRLDGEKAPASAFFFTDPWGTLIEILAISDFPA